MLKIRMPVLAVLLACSIGSAHAETRKPDNAAVNSRDRSEQALTPIDQSQDKADIDMVAAARREVLKIDGLSVSGQNIKIITGSGRMTLRGPVATVGERQAIETALRKISGKTTVDNQLEVE